MIKISLYLVQSHFFQYTHYGYDKIITAYFYRVELSILPHIKIHLNKLEYLK